MRLLASSVEVARVQRPCHLGALEEISRLSLSERSSVRADTGKSRTDKRPAAQRQPRRLLAVARIGVPRSCEPASGRSRQPNPAAASVCVSWQQRLERARERGGGHVRRRKGERRHRQSVRVHARFHRPRVRPLAGVLKVDGGWGTSTASTRGCGAPRGGHGRERWQAREQLGSAGSLAASAPASDRAATPLIDLD